MDQLLHIFARHEKRSFRIEPFAFSNPDENPTVNDPEERGKRGDQLIPQPV